MIIDISIENFLSIKEKVTLSLEGSTSKRLEKNYFNIDEKEKLLKSIAIYGANASGKSNIIKGFFNMLSMIISSGNFKPSQTIPFTPFLLDENLNETTKFEINLIIDEIKYNYFFSYNNNEIVEESLYYWPNKTKALIFKRNGSEFKFNVDKAEQERLSKLTLENNLFLSKSAQLNYNKTRILYEYFFNNFIINIHSGWENFTIKQISENEQLK